MTQTKYGKIASDLREQILSGRYQPGDRLPPIPELVASYGVSRDTVRDAIGALTNEGLVTPLRGFGTIVRATAPVTLGYTPETSIRTWAQQLRDSTASDIVVSATWEQADPGTAERLAITPGDRVIHRVRHQSMGGGVASFQQQWIPEAIAAAILTEAKINLADKDDIANTDLFSLMRHSGYNPTSVTEHLSARMPDPTERDIMSLPPGVPVLTSKRTTWDTDKKPLEASTLTGAADRISYAFTLPL
jgi:GntR family transcriptional regulator